MLLSSRQFFSSLSFCFLFHLSVNIFFFLSFLFVFKIYTAGRIFSKCCRIALNVQFLYAPRGACPRHRSIGLFFLLERIGNTLTPAAVRLYYMHDSAVREVAIPNGALVSLPLGFVCILCCNWIVLRSCNDDVSTAVIYR